MTQPVMLSERYVDANGRLTPAGYQLLADLQRRVLDLEARLAAAGVP